ncbi:DEAD/DEAH box helicase [Pseudidiomarina sp.]|jgi:superfamily II DNA or RNA helicase|uniref:DEAD/DEAH box helicase n=1 Tax=Pseudidiomarina sp. TaxID=2081707 RepID=UPI003A96EEFC
MTLRRWQSECINKALEHFSIEQHFFCQATPGAGKTRMAAELALKLFDQGRIDVVICFAPSCQVVEGFQRAFEGTLQRPFDGQIGAAGVALTYQSIEHKDESFWRLFRTLRVFAIFDEIHHCSGGDGTQGANIWGQKIIQQLQDAAALTLAMSGTPWRSDEHSIALARYSTPEGRLIVDYQYSLAEAVEEDVCRAPHITLVDNTEITIEKQGNTHQSYTGFAPLLKQSEATFENLVTHEELNLQLLELSRQRLDIVRRTVTDAACLVVATNIDHAHQISALLLRMNESSVVVTTHRTDANDLINEFRYGTAKWIVAVGMIAEGTDIPRLQVCCYLSRIRTEMYFRQVLGRVLRRRSGSDAEAWMFMLAEPELMGCAERLMDDLPEHLAVCQHLHLVSEHGDFTLSNNVELHASEAHASVADAALPPKNPAISFRQDSEDLLGTLVISGVFREQLLAFF